MKTGDILRIIENLEKEMMMLKERVNQMEKTTTPSYPPVWPNTTPYSVKYGCSVCGIGADGKSVGYVCNRSDCPTRVTC